MLIDIFDDRYQPIGTAEKKIAHRDGLWHRTFSCLVINPAERTVLLQKKTPGRYLFDRPDYADFTVGGHYEAGETIPDGVREIREELGLYINYPDLHPLGIRQTAVTLAPDWIEREFQHWHLLPLDHRIEDIPLDDAEVSGLVEIDIDDAIALTTGEQSQVTARFLVRKGPDRRIDDNVLTVDDLIPGYLTIDQLYLRLFIASRRYLAGDRTHLYW